MEEVWKDITLASLNEETRSANLGGVMFQDFLQTRPRGPHAPSDCTILSSSSSQPPPSPAPLLTALSLSSRPPFNPFHFHSLSPKHSSSPSDSSVCDRRNKRMIKNRESAARSRARKQAYTNELELKVELLREENARLRRQQQQLSEAAASQQQKRKNALYRTSTAPF